MSDLDGKLIYTAQSKQYFYCRDAICEFIFLKGGVPLNPFRLFDYFLGDRVGRDQIRDANRRVLQVSDEVWVFGDTLADGVIIEVTQALQQKKPIRFFSVGASVQDIQELPFDRLNFEHEVVANSGLGRPELLEHLIAGTASTVVAAMGRATELHGY